MVDIRQYEGIFTGKWVKPLEGEHTEGFNKGDQVVVFHFGDFLEFLKDFDLIMHGSSRTWR